MRITQTEPVDGAQNSSELETSSQVSIIGRPPNFWLFSELDGFDLTRPAEPDSRKVFPRLILKTTLNPVILSPAKAALVIVDMQNYFLATALAKGESDGRRAEAVLLKDTIPAARQAGIQIIWITWGISDTQLETLPPTLYRNFGFDIPESGNVAKRSAAGIGESMGTAKLKDGSFVYVGRKLMRDQWNTELHGDLLVSYKESLKSPLPDVRFHKDRISGFGGNTNDCEAFLKEKGITTLLFGGVNTDQCVYGSLQDAFTKGFDTILLTDACATTSPEYATSMVEFNCRKVAGFVSDSKSLFEGARHMETGSSK